MGEMKKSALIAGASGLVGRHCLNVLLEEPYYRQVVALVRRPLPLAHPRLVQGEIDFDRLEAAADLIRGDDVFCCLGTTIKNAGSQEAFRKVDAFYPLQLATIAVQQGASQFLIISALGANPRSKIFYNRVKGDVEEALSAIQLRSLHIFRPSMLLGKRTEQRPGEIVGTALMKAISFALRGPWQKYQAIDALDVAKAMVKVASMDLSGKHTFESDQIRSLARRL
jgi:uncharacterized protein YbjT (DUF2867 family)